MNRNLLKSSFSDERGTETVEWALMAGLIVASLVVIVLALGTWVRNRIEGLQAELETAP